MGSLDFEATVALKRQQSGREEVQRWYFVSFGVLGEDRLSGFILP